MSDRFTRPAPGEATPVRFPRITRAQLDNGLRVWTIPFGAIPVATVTLAIARGTGEDPPHQHGLASLTGDLLDEGAGDLDAIELAEAFARIGTQLDIDVGPDVMTVSCSGLSRALDRILELVASVVRRPRLEAPDFARVRELRVNRLRQLSRSAGTVADRAYVAAVFGDHAYGHGALGTTAALEAMSVDDTRGFWQGHIGPSIATLIVSGQVAPAEVTGAARRVFDTWDAAVGPSGIGAASVVDDPRVLLVDRPGAAQSELRIGHVAPGRATPDYHPLVVLNAVLGGQFTSRINRRLREEKGITYGAHTSFDFRRLAGSFSCDTSVQTDATADAVADVLAEFGAVRGSLVSGEELAAARASLTRGYVRNFETAGQIVRAATQLAVHDLPDDTFDRFVPAVEAVGSDAVLEAAGRHVRPEAATVVVVGDAGACAGPLERIGRPVEATTPEF
jgi:predicted Zn-dependent peptidase